MYCIGRLDARNNQYSQDMLSFSWSFDACQKIDKVQEEILTSSTNEDNVRLCMLQFLSVQLCSHLKEKTGSKTWPKSRSATKTSPSGSKAILTGDIRLWALLGSSEPKQVL